VRVIAVRVVRPLEGEIELSIFLVPRNESTTHTIPNVTNTLHAFAVEFVGTSIGKTIIDEFKAY